MKRIPQIFISYARADVQKVEGLYQRLSDAGFKPWTDKKDIVPGEMWKNAIKRAIRASDFVFICLSTSSVGRRGMIQREIKEALDMWQEKMEDDIYLIPVRLEDCEVPESLGHFQYVDLFDEGGWTKLLGAIQEGLARRPKSDNDEPEIMPGLYTRALDGVSSETKIEHPGNAIPEKDSPLVEVSPSKVRLTRRIVDVLGYEMQLVPSGKAIIGEWGMTRESEVAEFFIDRFPVTNKNYEKFILETKHDMPYYNAEWAREYNWMNSEMFDSRGNEQSRDKQHLYPSVQGDHPVVLVSWLDAQAYCKWRSQKSGLSIRLPTAEEWEKAARGNDGRCFPWGEAVDLKKCNLRESRVGRTTPVLAYVSSESPYEVADLIGNVWEWTLSERPDHPGEKISKGGSWKTSEVLVSCSSVRSESAHFIASDVGFRCVTSSIT